LDKESKMDKPVIPCPRLIHCGAREYTLKLVSLDEDLATRDANAAYLNNKKAVMTIDQDWPYHILVESLFHELTHAVNSVYFDKGIDEDSIERLSHGLAQILADFCVIDFSVLKGAKS